VVRIEAMPPKGYKKNAASKGDGAASTTPASARKSRAKSDPAADVDPTANDGAIAASMEDDDEGELALCCLIRVSV
jgi:hypothetical protein